MAALPIPNFSSFRFTAVLSFRSGNLFELSQTLLRRLDRLAGWIILQHTFECRFGFRILFLFELCLPGLDKRFGTEVGGVVKIGDEQKFFGGFGWALLGLSEFGHLELRAGGE